VKKTKNTGIVAVLMTAAILLCGGLALTAFAEPPAANVSGSSQEGKITIKGTATIYGEWSCQGDADIQTTPGEALAPVPGYPGGVQSTLVKVTVKNIECGNGTMNKHMRKALKENKSPETDILYNGKFQGMTVATVLVY
jgi:hypothetical protein